MIATLRIAHLVIGLALTGVLHAQAPEDATKAQTVAPAYVEVQDIPLAAEREIADLKMKLERFGGAETEYNLENRYRKLADETRVLQENEWALRPDILSTRARAIYLLQWQSLQEGYEDWNRSLDNNISSLQTKRFQLQQLKGLWQATLDTYPGDIIAPAVRERIDTVISLTSELDKLYMSKMNRLSVLYHEVQPDMVLIGDVMHQFDEVEKRAFSRLFSMDSPPMWQLFSEPVDDGSKTRRLIPPVIPKNLSLSALMDTYRGMLIVHGLIALALLAVTIPLSRRRKQWKEKEYLSRAVALFSSPVSMAVLLTLLFSYMFYGAIALRAQDLRALLIAVLTMRVLHPMVEGRTRKMLYISIGLFIAIKLTEFAPSFSLAERFGLFAVNLATAWFLYYVSRALPLGDQKNRFLGWTRTMAKLSLPLMVLGLVSNLLGNISLAEAITLGSVLSIATAVVLVAGVLILETTTRALLHIRAVPQFKTLHRHRDLFERRAFLSLRLIALFLWVNSTLAFFSVNKWVGQQLRDIVTYRIQLGSLDLSAMDVIAFVLSLYVATLLSRLVRFLLEEEVYQRVQMPRGLPNTVSMLVNYGILAIGFFVAISVAGIDLSRFAIIAGALGVGIGFGLQNVVNNFVSGLILMFERPIQVGDTIEVGVLIGHVLRIGFRSSTVRTYDGAEVIVPNGNLISSEVVNWTLSDRTRRLDIPVGVAYGSDPQKVLDVLTATAHAHQDVQPYPAPSIIFKGFGESSLDFSVRVWIKDFEELYRVSSEMAVKIYEALNEAGLEIPFPQRDLHLRSVSPGITLSGPQPGTGEDKGK